MKVLAALAVLIAPAAAARADSGAPDQGGFIGQDRARLEIDNCPPVPGVADAELQKIAREHYERGEVLYVQGDYEGAVLELASSYCLTPYYTILKDIGQAYERLLRYGDALAYFERYVMAVPKDAQRTSPCAPDPQDDKRVVLSRIEVLRHLKAAIRINTDPPDAKITLSNDTGVEARGSSGDELVVGGGRHQMTIEHAGFHALTVEIRAEIGKPYTYFEKLEPVKGRLRVRVVPAEARLFLDKRQVGTGELETELPGGRYQISAEAPDHVTVQKDIEVLPDRDTPVSFELPSQPEFGRKQLLLFSGLGGAAAGALLAGAQNSADYIVGGLAAGAAAGLFATYYGTPHDLALGTSSMTVSASLIGGVIGGATAALTTENGNVAAPLIGGGMIVGAATGYYIGDRLHVRPGEAAIVNSGALWGSVTGALFYGSFNPGRTIGGGLVLSGLGMGTIGGVLITRYFTISRGRSALIDVGGVVGLFVGLAAQNIVNQTQNRTASSAQQSERASNYALGGLASGLLLAGVLTRNMDDPKLGISPVIQKTQTATTVGVGGSF